MRLECPIHGNAESTAKISGIVRGGYGTWTHYDTYVVNRLAVQLAPPSKPGLSCLGRLILGVLYGITVLLIGFGPIIFIGFYGIFLGVLLLLMFFMYALVVGLEDIWREKLGRAMQKSEYMKWEKAMAKWERSRYCYSDDIVYDTETNDHCDPGNLTGYLYR
jgi:hypothetical protein